MFNCHKNPNKKTQIEGKTYKTICYLIFWYLFLHTKIVEIANDRLYQCAQIIQSGGFSVWFASAIICVTEYKWLCVISNTRTGDTITIMF